MTRSQFPIVALLTIFTLGVGCSARPDPPAVVTFLDVGQGDCTVIETREGKVIIIDGGGQPGTSEQDGADPGHRILLPYLRLRGINVIDVLIATHPDEDHVQGLATIGQHLRIGRAYLGGRFESGAAGRLRKHLESRGVPMGSLRRGDSLRFGTGIECDVVHPGPSRVPFSRSPDNDHGIVLRLRVGQSTALLTGDIEDAAERQILASSYPVNAQLLKVAHHGSRSSTSEFWLKHVRPRWAVVSAGRRNRFGHPSPVVLERLRRQGIHVLRTDELGAIRAIPSGAGWKFATGRNCLDDG